MNTALKLAAILACIAIAVSAGASAYVRIADHNARTRVTVKVTRTCANPFERNC